MGMIRVLGATGKVGRHVVAGLLERQVEVRALVRDPAAARLPEGVAVARGGKYPIMDPRGGGPHNPGRRRPSSTGCRHP